MNYILKNIYQLFVLFNRIVYKFLIMPIKRSMFAECGKNVSIGRGSSIHYQNVKVGNNVSIGSNALFLSSKANIKIGNNVMFGPRVSIITGDHRIDIIGRFMINVMDSEKNPENDMDIVIQDDVWFGANSIILKGVVIGEGSVIAAGSVVTKNIEPYSIYAGVPAKRVKERFNKEQIIKHKQLVREGL